MSREKKTGYDPHGIEERWIKVWEAAGSSHVDESSPKPPYAIVIPPPNITGFLHIGHAMNNTLQDILIRWRRMQGYNALWLPGTDHAGIATQNVVERQLRSEGVEREALGREGFVERVWQWKEESGGTIIRQLKRLGAFCDWERECFTMDEPRQQAVREVFVRLFHEGLIYRGERLINWCPRCRTALSDIEVEHEETKGLLYHIAYPLADDPTTRLVVATTRPETMLGDTAVAVHPDDPRHNDQIGRRVMLPLTGRSIPVVGDSILVDREFGTGAVKITPAHDFNDFEAGERHGLPRIALFDEAGRISSSIPDAQIEPALYREIEGLGTEKAREIVVRWLQDRGLLVKVDAHLHAVGKCYRCRTVVEPLLSPQWFVRVGPLAEPAIRAVEEGRTRFVPQHWENTYFAWMRNIKDWCISRQLWWGHQVPAWYCRECDGDNLVCEAAGAATAMATPRDEEAHRILRDATPIVASSLPAACPRCGGHALVRDPDVLDTWFSSALWPFSTMGWPEQTELLRRFYPTSTLVTSFDIIFFWVARMMMMGLKFMNDVPFREVYIHALVRDAEGQKMSKSKGNVIDPLEIIDKHGADAFRFTLAALAAQGRDIRLSEERIEGYRHFCNKLWNAHQFLARYLPILEGPLPPVNSLSLDLADRWLLHRLYGLIGSVTGALEEYRFNEAASALYQFVWHEYCDWYLEIVKSRLTSESSREQQQAGVALLLFGLETALRLLHPFMPFITEEIWQQLPHRGGTSLMLDHWPKADPVWEAADADASMGLLMDLTRAARDLRSDLEIPPSKWVRLVLRTASDNDDRAIEAVMPYLAALTRAEQITFGRHLDRPSPGAVGLVSGIEVHLPVDDLSVFTARQQKLRRELDKVEQELARVDKKLSNADFVSKAPPEVVTKQREEQTKLVDTRTKLLQHLERIDQLVRPT